jgi:hypothetical protein
VATDNAGVTAVDLALSTDGGMTYPGSVATGLANTGSYAWTVPELDTTTARVRVTAHDAAGHVDSDMSVADFTISNPVSAIAGTLLEPGDVLGIYPNPARAGQTRVLLRLPSVVTMDVSIYDIRGHLVRRLQGGSFPSGVRATTWDGRDDNGNPASTGLYLVRLTANPGIHQTKRLVLFR